MGWLNWLKEYSGLGVWVSAACAVTLLAREMNLAISIGDLLDWLPIITVVGFFLFFLYLRIKWKREVRNKELEEKLSGFLTVVPDWVQQQFSTVNTKLDGLENKQEEIQTNIDGVAVAFLTYLQNQIDFYKRAYEGKEDDEKHIDADALRREILSVLERHGVSPKTSPDDNT